MQIIIKQKILEKALAHANWIIERKNTVPILGYVLFDANTDRGLTITATNMDMTIIDTINCEILENGTYCLPAGLLYDITKKLPSSAEVTLEKLNEKNSIKVQAGKASFEINYMDASNFPPIANTVYDVNFSMNTKILKNAINISKVAMLQDNTRFHLNGIHMHHENENGINKLRFVATDLFRISCVSAPAPMETQNMPPIIISKRAVSEALKLADTSVEEATEISISENRISFKIKSADDINTEFSSRLINGTFPEYKAALEVSNNKILTLNTDDFIDALDRVSTVVMDSTNSIKIDIKQDRAEISGISREFGSAHEDVEASFSVQENLEICFNSKYLLEILKEIKTPQTKMRLAESHSSTIIEPLYNDSMPDLDMVFAVMPIEIVQN
ncbi:MAG: DNA polymerase III subunit beta [Alphaproteobacteria bacterium]|nr:DNA polymerase III subunit beta [Alphaproteobacteria bacterium]